MDHEDLRRKRRRLFEPDNQVDPTKHDKSNTGANRVSSSQNDLAYSGIQQPSSSNTMDLGLDNLTSMGFDGKRARNALRSAGGDVQRALDRLFSNPSDDDDFEDAHGTSMPQTTTDDEALARQLQAKYDAQPQTGTNEQYKRVDSGITDITDDEAYARLLQAQFDGTDSMHGHDSGAPLATSNEELTATEPSLQSAQVEHTVRSIADAITGVRCLNCRKFIIKNESHIQEFSKYIQDSEAQLIAIPCQSCRNTHNDQRARLYMIWALLCDFDTTSKHNKPDKRRSTKTPKSTAGNGTGYSGYYSYGARQAASVEQPATVQLSNADDAMTAGLMSTLHSLLPTFDREDDFELEAKQLQSLFLCSSVLERAAELLRNNDLEEVMTQRVLYAALARFLQTLAMHPSTSALVFGERVARNSGASLLKISLGKASLAGKKEIDTVQPLSQCLQEFAIQGSLMLGDQGFDANETQLFQAFIDLRDFLQANGSSVKKASTQDKNAWHKEYAVSVVPDEYILENNCLVSKAQQSGQVLPGRMKRIMQEISRLHTSLPEGIFVRYGSSRPDVMKIIIIGPQDTPYENGLFEFDLLCGDNFPTGPPQMQLRTTGGGAVGFNPNLYPCGKVCLSLLGTWSGETWDAKTSTLLQVLVSIQAMIFCEQPWYNEPGRGNTDPANKQSMAYNKSLQPHTVTHGMIDWLEGRSYQTSQYRPGGQKTTPTVTSDETIWSAIVENHFRANEGDIRATISKWTSQSDAPSTGDLAQDLRAAVSQLSKGVPRAGAFY